MALIREYASKLPPDALVKYRRTFDQFDRDGGGDVDVRELGVMFRALRQFPSDRELQRMVEDVDDDGSGTIDFNEFCGLMLRLSRAKSMPRWLRLALDPTADAAEGEQPTAGAAVATTAGAGSDSHMVTVTADGHLDLSAALGSEELQLATADLLSAASHVRSLDCAANALTASGFLHLCAALVRNASIERLALAGCGLRDAEAELVASLLRANRSLTSADLRDNALSDTGVLAIAEAVHSANTSLRALELGGNRALTPSAGAALAPLLLRNSLGAAVELQLPEIALGSSRLEPMHAAALRLALLPPPPAGTPAALSAASGGGPRGPRLLPTSIDLSDNPLLGDRGVRGLFFVRSAEPEPGEDEGDSGAGSSRPGSSGVPGGAQSPAARPRSPPERAAPGHPASASASGPGRKQLLLQAPPAPSRAGGGGVSAQQPLFALPSAAPFGTQVRAMLSRTTQLALDGVGVGDAGVAAFAAALGVGELPLLRELSLRGNPMGADPRVLGRLGAVLAANCAGLREFRISRCARVTDEAASALLREWLPRVARAHAKLAKGAKGGAGGRAVEPLHLFLGGTRAGDGAAAVAAAALGLGLCLGVLSLGTAVGDAGAAAIGGALGAGGVVAVLQLGDRIADSGCVPLMDGVRDSRTLKRLLLGGALLETVAAAVSGTEAASSAASAEGLGEGPSREPLPEEAELPDEGSWELDAAALAEFVQARADSAAALAAGRKPPPMPLGFSANLQLGEAAALAIGDCLQANSGLARLDLAGCAGIGDAGIGAILARLAFNRSLRTLTAAGCGVAEAEREAEASARLTGGGPRTPKPGAREAGAAVRPKLDGRSVAVRALKEALRTNHTLAEVRLFGAAEERRSSFANSRELLELAAVLAANAEKGAWRIEESGLGQKLAEWQWVFRELAPGGQDLPPERWSSKEIAQFVRNAGLAQYAESVAANCLSPQRLLGLDVCQLGQLGVRDFGHQKLLLDRIRSTQLAFEQLAEAGRARAQWEALTRSLALAAEEAEAAREAEAAHAAALQGLSLGSASAGAGQGRGGQGGGGSRYPVGGLPQSIFGTGTPPALRARPRAAAKPAQHRQPRLAPITGMPRRFTAKPRWEPPPPRSGSASPRPRRQPSAAEVLRSIAHLGGPQPHPAIAALQALVQGREGPLSGGRGTPHGRELPRLGGAQSLGELHSKLAVGLEVHVKTIALPLDTRPNLLI